MTAVLAPIFVAPSSVSHHAAEQYQARVKPLLALEDASRELLLLLGLGTTFLLAEPPDWVRGHSETFTRLFEVSDGIIIPVAPDGTAITCLVRGLPMCERRAKKRRRELGRRKAAARRVMRSQGWARRERQRVISWE